MTKKDEKLKDLLMPKITGMPSQNGGGDTALHTSRMLPSTFRAFNASEEIKPLKSARERHQPSIGTQLISARRRQQKQHMASQLKHYRWPAHPCHSSLQVGLGGIYTIKREAKFKDCIEEGSTGSRCAASCALGALGRRQTSLARAHYRCLQHTQVVRLNT